MITKKTPILKLLFTERKIEHVVIILLYLQLPGEQQEQTAMRITGRQLRPLWMRLETILYAEYLWSECIQNISDR
jgi:hypothetical protein